MPNWKLKSEKLIDSHKLAFDQLLANRGVANLVELEKYSNLDQKSIREFLDNDFIKSIKKSVKIINTAIKENLPVVIHGDYDADGITSTAVLWQAIYEELGYKNVFPYIPSRFDEGYGLSFDSLQAIDEKYFGEKKGLLITVDCGITAVEQIKKAQEMGIKVLLTDHHQKAKDVPQSDCLVWTDKLCGVGIVYFIVSSLIKKEGFGIDLVAIGTIADLQPLANINRELVKRGLEIINKNPRVGVKQLLNISGFEKEVKAKDVGWVIAPRINASGRLENAFDALRLLCTKDISLAQQYSRTLNQINIERQQKTLAMIKIAENQVNGDPISFITGKDFHEGIVGLVAGRLTQKYYKPALVIQIENGIAKGSARSIPEINIIELLRKFEPDFINLGGHSAAAGFSIGADKLESLKSNLINSFKDINQGNLYKNHLHIEYPIDLSIFDEKLFEIVETLEPYGVENPSPLFLIKGLRVVDFKIIGKDQSHLTLNLTNETEFIRGVGFGMAELAQNLKFDEKVDIVCSITKNEWNGNITYEFQLKDLKYFKN